MNLCRNTRQGHIQPNQAFLALYYSDDKKETYDGEYAAYEKDFKDNPQPNGSALKDPLTWRNEKAADDLEEAPADVKSRVETYVEKFNLGEISGVKDFIAIETGDQTLLEAQRIARAKKLQK